MIRLKLWGLAVLGLVGAIFAAIQVGVSKGKNKEKIKQKDRLLDDIHKANTARRDPDYRKRVFDEDNP